MVTLAFKFAIFRGCSDKPNDLNTPLKKDPRFKAGVSRKEVKHER